MAESPGASEPLNVAACESRERLKIPCFSEFLLVSLPCRGPRPRRALSISSVRLQLPIRDWTLDAQHVEALSEIRPVLLDVIHPSPFFRLR